MVSWISSLCTLCAMSALAQMMLPQEKGREGIRMICGMLMLHLTCENAVRLLDALASCGDLKQMFSCLIR